MSQFPEDDVARELEYQLRRWNVPDNLRGRVVESFEELKKLMPEDDKFGEVQSRGFESREGKGFYRYVRKSKKGGVKSVAYGCPHCKKIIIGAPKMKGGNTIDSSRPMTGSKGLRYHCSNCFRMIYSFHWEYS